MTKTEISRSALKVYVAFAAIVFGLSLAYCAATGRMLELAIIGAGVTGLGILTASTYRSL